MPDDSIEVDEPQLTPGKQYTLGQLARLTGSQVPITVDDRIVYPELEWERMTADRLLKWLRQSIADGEIDGNTQIVVDSDPEGNGLHPMRAAVEFGRLVEGRGVHPEWEPDSGVTLPATAIKFGVGY